MRYRECQKRASYPQKSNDHSTEHTIPFTQICKVDIPFSRRSPDRKLTLRQEFLVTKIKVLLVLFVDDLAFIFNTSNTSVSQNSNSVDQAFTKRVAI